MRDYIYKVENISTERAKMLKNLALEYKSLKNILIEDSFNRERPPRICELRQIAIIENALEEVSGGNDFLYKAMRDIVSGEVTLYEAERKYYGYSKSYYTKKRREFYVILNRNFEEALAS